jgi:hypothetical protein
MVSTPSITNCALEIGRHDKPAPRTARDGKRRITMWKAFKITLGIVLGLLAIPTVIAIISAVKLSN